MVQKIGIRVRVPGWEQLENSLCQPSSKRVPFLEFETGKVEIGDGWALPSICCA